MDLGQKPAGELFLLAHFAAALSDGLRDIDDTDELRCELDSFRASVNLEMSGEFRMSRLPSRGLARHHGGPRDGSGSPPGTPPTYPPGGDPPRPGMRSRQYLPAPAGQ
jgi:hypothetical protein